jgi:hypothetical protein
MLCHFLNKIPPKKLQSELDFQVLFFGNSFSILVKDSWPGISHSKDALQNQLLELYSFKIAVLAANPGIK